MEDRPRANPCAESAEGRSKFLRQGSLTSLKDAQLFNLHADPAESKNLAAENPNIVKHLSHHAEQSRTTLGDYTGPGNEVRFHDTSPRWPIANAK